MLPLEHFVTVCHSWCGGGGGLFQPDRWHVRCTKIRSSVFQIVSVYFSACFTMFRRDFLCLKGPTKLMPLPLRSTEGWLEISWNGSNVTSPWAHLAQVWPIWERNHAAPGNTTGTCHQLKQAGQEPHGAEAKSLQSTKSNKRLMKLLRYMMNYDDIWSLFALFCM